MQGAKPIRSAASDSIGMRVQCGEMAVRQALSGILAQIADFTLDPEEISTVELVLAEALNNIVEHAYPIPDDDQPIDIECCMQTDGLHVTVTDIGLPMPDGHAPIGMPQKVDVDLPDMPEGGFGWFLIQGLAKDVRYRRENTTNRLDLRIAVGLPNAY